MKKIINDNYNSIVKRGLITKETNHQDFIQKLDEEVAELFEAVNCGLPNRNEEIADVILVCLNYAKHYNIDIEQELKNKILINKNR